MGRTRKTAHSSLGMSLVKKKKIIWDRSTNCEHPVEENANLGTTALKSVTEESSYDEFIATATLASTLFTAEKLNVKFVALSTSSTPSTGEEGGGCGDEDGEFTEEDKRLVVVPRRPEWTREMSGMELAVAEREAFLGWRRAMAHLQNREGLTPFERNIEVWRQLWRVVERSQVIVQILDARNPLLYRCEDLEVYVRELGDGDKKNVLLINKADFLTPEQRGAWSTYFQSIGLPHAFYSAAAVITPSPKHPPSKSSSQQESIPQQQSIEEQDTSSEDEEDVDDDENQEESFESIQTKILSRDELISFLTSFKTQHEQQQQGGKKIQKIESSKEEEVFAIGLVGYPNVGKSSTINSLMDAKKTSVSSTPGKTKHFQTLFLEDDLLLCDCPGLVMPAFGGSKGEMVLGGILPIDQLTSYSSPMELLVNRIPLARLEHLYGVTLSITYSAQDFLNSYAAIRGFMTVRGIPDCSRASRIVLKDYVNGKLCYCVPPPGVEEQQFNPPTTRAGGRHIMIHPPQHGEGELGDQQENRRPLAPKVRMEAALDHSFFAPTPTSVHIKGKQYIGDGSAPISGSSSNLVDSKPWKKHGNRNKKEKLRRLYRHLDV